MEIEKLVSRIRMFVERETKLNSILYLRLVLKPVDGIGYMHIASERETAYIPVFRVKGKPYIPLTSVYGVLRSLAESIAKSSAMAIVDEVDRLFIGAHCELEEDTVRHICTDLGKEYIELLKALIEELSKDRSLYRYFATDESIAELRTVFGKGIEKLSEVPRAIEPILSSLCPICRLFGGPGIETRVRILRVEPRIRTLHTLTHVAIDRASSVAYPGYLYTTESIAIDRLDIDVFVKNVVPRSTEARILKAVLKYLADIGISIGAHKSIGLGKLKLDTKESKGIYIDLNTIESPEKLTEIIVDLQNLAQEPIDRILNILHS